MFIYTTMGISHPLLRKTQNKLLYIKLFIMNKQNYFSAEYVAPEVEVISTVVEHGFSASFGDFGEAGDGYDTDDNGDF